MAISSLRALAHGVLAPLEALYMRKTKTHNPPIFIIGPPRSGTSLLYEMMITRFHFSYMSNAAHRFYKTPLSASMLFQDTIYNWSGDFTSHYGHINGWGAPNEGGWIWQRWLEDGPWSDGVGYPNDKIAAMQQMLAGFELIGKAPFLNKNVMHSNRLQLMSKIWPHALFIEVKRDYADNARSIIRAQTKEGIDMKWWSVKPKITPNHYGKDIVERAVAQVIGVTHDIEADKHTIGENRFFEIPYTKLCECPEKLMLGIKQFLKSHGVYIQDKGVLPSIFKPSPSQPLALEDEKRLIAYLNEIH